MGDRLLQYGSVRSSWCEGGCRLLLGTAQDCCVRRHLGTYLGPYSLLSGVVGEFVPSMFLQCPTWSTAFGARW